MHLFNFLKNKIDLFRGWLELILKQDYHYKYFIERIGYTDTHEDVIQEVIDGRNANPSAALLRKSIDIHRSVRRELYDSILKKISNECLSVA